MFRWLIPMTIILFVAWVRVLRLRVAGHIRPHTPLPEVLWSAFVLPVLQALWAGVYETIRTAARGRRQKPPFTAFLLAWITQRSQPVTKTVAVTECNGFSNPLSVTEWVRPPRPPGRPRKYVQGWRAARRTGRPRGRPRKTLPATDPAHER